MKLNVSTHDVPETVINHPAMMTVQEKSMLYHLARDEFKGNGIIIDAGLFLCASTVAFAHGLRQNASFYDVALSESAQKPIQAYDIAIWHSSMDKHLNDPAVRVALEDIGRPQPGASFRPLLEGILAPISDLVELHVGDIRETLSCNRAVEIAFYDCMKSASIDKAVFRNVGPHLNTGSIIIQQDYFYDRAIDLKIRQELLSDYFDFIGQFGGSGVFRMTRRIPKSFFTNDPVDALSFDDKARLLSQAADRVNMPRPKMYTLLSLAEFYLINDKIRQSIDVVAIVDSISETSSKEQTTPRIKRRLKEIRSRCGV